MHLQKSFNLIIRMIRYKFFLCRILFSGLYYKVINYKIFCRKLLTKGMKKIMGNETKTKKAQPKGFYVCNFTSVFERLAYYGAKPILLLFLITAVSEGGLGIDSVDAAVIAANLTAYTYFAPVIGGYICDNWLGARYAIPLGTILMGVGYFIGSRATTAGMVNLMVIIVAIGTGLFKGNLSAILGRMYDNKEDLDIAFSLKYSYVNVGAFIGSLMTGFLYLHLFKKGDVLGFRQSFLVSVAFCAIATIWFVANWKNLNGQGVKPFKFKTDINGNIIGEEKKEKSDKKSEPLTKLEKNRVVAIILVSVLSIIFWLFYYQQDLALTIYMTKFVNMNVGSFEVPPGWVTTTFNGLLCVVLGGVMATIWRKLSQRPQGDLNMFQKVGLSFLFSGLAFGIMVVAEFVRGVGAPESEKVSVIWLFGFVFVLTVGEMCFSPLKDAFVSKYAPKKYTSLLMGVMIIATFCASKLSPYVQLIVNKFDIFPVLLGIFILLMICTVFMMVTNKMLNRLVEGEE